MTKNNKALKPSDDISVLMVEDNTGMRQTLIDILSEEGYKVTGVGTLALAKKELKKRFYNIALVDIKLPDGSGLELLQETKKINKETLTIIITAMVSAESAIFAVNEDAFAYIQKPVNMDELKETIKKAVKIQRLSIENKYLLEKLKLLSLKDTHTELYNYRYLLERMASEIKRAKRYVLPLSVIMLDIDYFKSINDVYGHQYGNLILKEFAKYLTHFVRGNDVVVRYGGEEFVVILPDTNKEGAAVFAQRLLDETARRVFDPEGNRISLKISAGVASFPADGGHSDTVAGILNLADKALLNAKEAGGNRLYAFRRKVEYARDIVKNSGRPGVHRVRKKLSKMMLRTNQALIESIYAFAKTIEAKDYYTGAHSESLAFIVTEIGNRLRLSENEIEDLKHAAMLHDIGKIGIPDNILLKRKKLTRKEYEEIKKHPRIGAEIIRPIHFLKNLLPIILYHHERYDGLGYSAGLKGKEIPLGARIIGIADVFQALISNRPYRKAYSKKEALEIVEEGSGTQFDPEIVKVFMGIMRSKRRLK